MKRVVLLTSSELRHTFFRKSIALEKGISVCKSYCESSEKNLVHKIEDVQENKLRHKHLAARTESEKTFFKTFCDTKEDLSNPVFIQKGAINDDTYVQEIINEQPDLIISYGCSIIKPALIEAFPDTFINIHLGLSPYYRGSGTNFWPFVNNEPEYCGVTYMKIDRGIDTGEIVHQIRPDIHETDTFHTICNRLLVKSFEVLGKLILSWPLSKTKHKEPVNFSEKYYKNSDFTEESLIQLYQNFENGQITNYLTKKEERDTQVPILENPDLSNE